MMFLKYRIRKLQAQVDIQKDYVESLRKAADEYKHSYYTDRFLEAHRKWIELNSKLMWLRANYEKRISR